MLVTRDWQTDLYFVAELRPDSFAAARQRSQWFFGELVTDQGLMEKPVDLRQPYAFYLGHCAAFTDIKLLQLPGSTAAYFRQHFERGIDPDVDDPNLCHAHSALPEKWPTPDELRAYEARVCNETQERFIARAQAGNGAGYTADELMCIEHSDMHLETLLYMRAEQLRNAPVGKQGHQRSEMALYSPTTFKDPPTSVVGASIDIPAGMATLGCDAGEVPFAWDNEMPAHSTVVEQFSVACLPVSNADFLEFVEAGAYEDERFWKSSNAASWAKKHRHPLRWTFGAFGKREWGVHLPLGGIATWQEARYWPVHVTFAEAEAYCAWRGNGARLMSEVEYERIFDMADELTIPAPSLEQPLHGVSFLRSACRGNNNFKFATPTPVGTLDDAPAAELPIYDLVGNGWEWTSTVFAPYKGFQAMSSYPEYSADFFDAKHSVCRGASMYTSKNTIRRSFRNFYQQRYPHIIAKFRLAQ